MANIVETVLKVTDQGSAVLKGYKGEVASAEAATTGSTGKMAGAFSSLKDHATQIALGAGTAIAGFAVESIGQFQNLGTEIGNFATATGTTTQEASRWVEVAKDMGIQTDAVQGAMGKLEKQLGANKDAFKEYGLQVATTKDGQIDANETFLNAIDTLNGITDPAKRAEAGAKMFGKSWQGMAELISSGSGNLKTSLAAVSDAKIFDDSKVQAARNLRGAFDQMKDSVEDVALTFGGALAPAISNVSGGISKMIESARPVFKQLGDEITHVTQEIAPVLSTLGDIAGKLSEIESKIKGIGGGAVGELGDLITGGPLAAVGALQDAWDANSTSIVGVDKVVKAMKTSIDQTANAHEAATADLARMYEEASRAGRGVDEITTAADSAKAAVARIKTEWDTLTGELDQQKSALNVKTAFEDVKQAASDAWDAAKSKSADAGKKLDEYQTKQLDLKQAVLDYSKTIDGLTPEVATKIFAEIDAGAFDQAAQDIANLTQTRPVILQPHVGQVSHFAKGTSSSPAGVALVGEEGPELVNLPGGSQVFPAAQTAALLGGSGGGGDIHIHTSADPRAVIAAIKEYKRKGGVL